MAKKEGDEVAMVYGCGLLVNNGIGYIARGCVISDKEAGGCCGCSLGFRRSSWHVLPLCVFSKGGGRREEGGR